MYRPGFGMDGAHSPEFSKKLGRRGWVGMAIPVHYGGVGGSPVERYVVTEELLGAGAPVNAHWFSDRQFAPSLLKYGTEAQRERFLPAIAAGECYFSIGMSEPDAGSDLAAVRSVARRTDGGWSLTGTKVWTTSAHLNHFIVALCRTSLLGTDRHEGLSQLIVDLHAEGVTINPILSIDGRHHFNEVVFDDVFVPEDMMLGSEGSGWQQVTSELAFERSGPDRFLSLWPLVRALLDESLASERHDETVGQISSRFFTVRQLSLSVARALEEERDASVEAALVKDLGTQFEQWLALAVQSMLDSSPNPGAASLTESLLASAILAAPAFTIRGGTTEVLRSIIAQALRAA